MKSNRLLLQWGLPVLLVSIAVFLGIVFSHHGLLDLRKFQSQLEATKERTAFLEDENRKLRRQLDLLEESSSQVLERKAREVFGLVRAGDTIYLEPSFR